MPEIPDLEAARALLNRDVSGLRIERVDVPRPIVVRAVPESFRARLEGAALGEVRRAGKFLLFALSTGDVLVVNPMLTGRFALVEAERRRPARLCFALALSDGRELRYIDERFMGKVYLTESDHVDRVPLFAEMGPDALDPTLTEEIFLERLRAFRGQVKNVLVNHKFVAGIGNAYADEILFVAGIHPFTKVRELGEERRRCLYGALREVLDWALPMVRERMGNALDEKPRDFLRVHRKGGEACPQCGAPISEVSPNKRITSFCRRCQPG